MFCRFEEGDSRERLVAQAAEGVPAPLAALAVRRRVPTQVPCVDKRNGASSRVGCTAERLLVREDEHAIVAGVCLGNGLPRLCPSVETS
jgi:hypothetical protein